MALTRCPDCHKELSDKATACPNCGCPVSSAESPTSQDTGEKATCPNCGSSQISAQKEGFDAQTACCSALLVGPLGILCGARKANQLNGICLKCGHKWIIQKDIKTKDENILNRDIGGKQWGGKQWGWIIAIFFILVIIGMCQK